MKKANKWCSKFTSIARLGIVCVAITSLFLINIATNPVGTIYAANNCNVKSSGATGDGTTNDTKAIQNAINSCSGGGIVTFPIGKYLTAPLFLLKGNITLNIMSGATILGSKTPSDYAPKSGQKSIGPTLALINSYKVSNITITGGGVIDGQGTSWWASGKSTHDRPRLVQIASGSHIKINNVTLQNAASMHLYLKNTSNVTVDHVIIHAPSNSPNTDGIDLNNSHDMLIENCNISTGDDNIAIKSGPTLTPTYNIKIIGCIFGQGHGVSIGNDLQGGVHDVIVENSTYTDTIVGIRIKATRTTGGKVTAITYKNLTMTKVKYPIWFSGYYPTIPFSDSAPQPVTATTPSYSHIAIANLTATGADCGIAIVGLPEMPFSAITLSTTVKIASKSGIMIRNTAGFTNSNTKPDSLCLVPPTPFSTPVT